MPKRFTAEDLSSMDKDLRDRGLLNDSSVSEEINQEIRETGGDYNYGTASRELARDLLGKDVDELPFAAVEDEIDKDKENKIEKLKDEMCEVAEKQIYEHLKRWDVDSLISEGGRENLVLREELDGLVKEAVGLIREYLTRDKTKYLSGMSGTYTKFAEFDTQLKRGLEKRVIGVAKTIVKIFEAKKKVRDA